jgi:hypothetical protein
MIRTLLYVVKRKNSKGDAMYEKNLMPEKHPPFPDLPLHPAAQVPRASQHDFLILSALI